MTPDQPATPGLHLETAVICAGRPRHAASEPLNVPIVLASNFHSGAVAAPGAGEESRAYSRTDATPGWEALESAVGQVEGGHAVAFSSGMAAIAAVLDRAPWPCGSTAASATPPNSPAGSTSTPPSAAYTTPAFPATPDTAPPPRR